MKEVFRMKVMLLGYKDLSFNDDNGKLVEGRNLYISYPISGVIGNECKRLFVSSSNSDLYNLDISQYVGKKVDIELGFNGKPVAITVA